MMKNIFFQRFCRKLISNYCWLLLHRLILLLIFLFLFYGWVQWLGYIILSLRILLLYLLILRFRFIMLRNIIWLLIWLCFFESFLILIFSMYLIIGKILYLIWIIRLDFIFKGVIALFLFRIFSYWRRWWINFLTWVLLKENLILLYLFILLQFLFLINNI